MHGILREDATAVQRRLLRRSLVWNIMKRSSVAQELTCGRWLRGICRQHTGRGLMKGMLLHVVVSPKCKQLQERCCCDLLVADFPATCLCISGTDFFFFFFLPISWMFACVLHFFLYLHLFSAIERFSHGKAL